MKQFISLIISIIILSNAVPAFARNSYITLTPYPYSAHRLGDDLVIYGDTDFGQVTLGFYYPEDQGYKGYAKFIMTIYADELRQGYVIPTETYSRLWPEGVWKIVVQNGAVRDEIKIPMAKEVSYDRSIKLAVYEDNTLLSLTSYPCRGTVIKDNVISFSLEDNTLVKIFSWNNFLPADTGQTRIFIASYKDGYLTDIKTFPGTLSTFGNHFTLDMGNNKTVKLFYWQDSLTPIE